MATTSCVFRGHTGRMSLSPARPSGHCLRWFQTMEHCTWACRSQPEGATTAQAEIDGSGKTVLRQQWRPSRFALSPGARCEGRTAGNHAEVRAGRRHHALQARCERGQCAAVPGQVENAITLDGSEAAAVAGFGGTVDGPVGPVQIVLLDDSCVIMLNQKPRSVALPLLTQVSAELQVPNSPIHSGCGLAPVTR